MKILILGGTGFIGPHEVDQAEDRDWSITIFNRGRSKTDLFVEDFAKVTRLIGDRDPNKGDGLKALAAAIKSGQRWDAVVDNSAYVPRLAKATAELLKDATSQYLFISTVSVYADRSKLNTDESADLLSIDDPTIEKVNGRTYGPLKVLCEQEVQRVYGDHASIIRPGLIVGPGDKTDRFTYWPVRCHRGGEVLIPAAQSPVQFIDVRDLAVFIMDSIEQGHGGIYNAVGPRGPLFFREMVDGCKAVVSTPVEFVPVPDSFLTEHGVNAFAGPESLAMWVPQQPGEMRAGTWSNQRAIEHGCTFRPLADTATATLDWFLASGRDPQDFGKRAGLSAAREQQLIKQWQATKGRPEKSS